MGRVASLLLVLGLCAGCARQPVQAPLTSVIPIIGLPPIPIDTTRPGLDVRPMPTAETIAATERTVRIAEGVEAAMLERRPVSMEYPAEARARRLAGHVTFRIIVSRDGSVEGLTLIEVSDAVFVRVATASVQSWQYRPYLLNGQPVAVDTTVQLNFVPPE